MRPDWRAETAAADDKKPNTLTPKEIADGWLMLFDGETTFGWKVVEGDVKVENGVLVVGGQKSTKLVTTAQFGGLEYQLDMEAGNGKPATGGGLYLPAIPQSPAFGFEAIKSGTGKGVVNGGGRNKPGAVRIEVPAGHVVRISRLWVRPSITRPLFNGKDLTGWKVFAATRSGRSRSSR